ncbi:MAG TPA: Uma2 family endonuclease [Acetobacteraceae bacterium]|nr:Uma2 family endonuclease [Acetobacteraceae bacterium]
MRTDQSEFGNAWRYELVRGAIVAHAAPSPEHGVVLANLAREIGARLRNHPECRSEIGSGAVPQYQQRDTARIPDAMIRCGQHPRVLFEVVSPSETTHKRQWDRKRTDLQAVEGVQEIIEIFQDEMLAHAYRRQASGWVFESIDGPEADIALPSVGITVPLAVLYERLPPEGG